MRCSVLWRQQQRMRTERVQPRFFGWHAPSQATRSHQPRHAVRNEQLPHQAAPAFVHHLHCVSRRVLGPAVIPMSLFFFLVCPGSLDAVQLFARSRGVHDPRLSVMTPAASAATAGTIIDLRASCMCWCSFVRSLLCCNRGLEVAAWRQCSGTEQVG